MIPKKLAERIELEAKSWQWKFDVNNETTNSQSFILGAHFAATEILREVEKLVKEIYNFKTPLLMGEFNRQFRDVLLDRIDDTLTQWREFIGETE